MALPRWDREASLNPDGFQHRMLALFRGGKDTGEIAREYGVREAVVYNAISRAREREREAA